MTSIEPLTSHMEYLQKQIKRNQDETASFKKLLNLTLDNFTEPLKTLDEKIKKCSELAKKMELNVAQTEQISSNESTVSDSNLQNEEKELHAELNILTRQLDGEIEKINNMIDATDYAENLEKLKNVNTRMEALSTDSSQMNISTQPVTEMNVSTQPVTEMNVPTQPVTEMNVPTQPVTEMNVPTQPVTDSTSSPMNISGQYVSNAITPPSESTTGVTKKKTTPQVANEPRTSARLKLLQEQQKLRQQQQEHEQKLLLEQKRQQQKRQEQKSKRNTDVYRITSKGKKGKKGGNLTRKSHKRNRTRKYVQRLQSLIGNPTRLSSMIIV